MFGSCQNCIFAISECWLDSSNLYETGKSLKTGRKRKSSTRRKTEHRGQRNGKKVVNKITKKDIVVRFQFRISCSPCYCIMPDQSRLLPRPLQWSETDVTGNAGYEIKLHVRMSAPVRREAVQLCGLLFCVQVHSVPNYCPDSGANLTHQPLNAQ
jgi:hypothetical protein